MLWRDLASTMVLVIVVLLFVGLPGASLTTPTGEQTPNNTSATINLRAPYVLADFTVDGLAHAKFIQELRVIGVRQAWLSALEALPSLKTLTLEGDLLHAEEGFFKQNLSYDLSKLRPCLNLHGQFQMACPATGLESTTDIPDLPAFNITEASKPWDPVVDEGWTWQTYLVLFAGIAAALILLGLLASLIRKIRKARRAD